MARVLVVSSSAGQRAGWTRSLTGTHTVVEPGAARASEYGTDRAEAVVLAMPARPVHARRVLDAVAGRHPGAALVAVVNGAPPEMTRWLRAEGVAVVVPEQHSDDRLRRAVDSALRVAATERAGGGRVAMDPMRQQAIVGGRRVTLSQREFSLYAYLLQKAGHVCTRSELLDTVWGIGFDPGSNIVDVAVRRLRRKVGSHELIETIRNVGYRLVA